MDHNPCAIVVPPVCWRLLVMTGGHPTVNKQISISDKDLTLLVNHCNY